MSDHDEMGRGVDGASADPPADEGAPIVETYEVDEGVVFYDAENPLAWVETTRTIRLAEYA